MKWKTAVRVMALALIVTAGCSTGKDLAQSTRTGRIHDVKIADALNPREVEVRLGDEVRWVNARNAAVKILFIDSLREKLACQKNFKVIENMAGISVNDHASLCSMVSGAFA